MILRKFTVLKKLFVFLYAIFFIPLLSGCGSLTNTLVDSMNKDGCLTCAAIDNKKHAENEESKSAFCISNDSMLIMMKIKDGKREDEKIIEIIFMTLMNFDTHNSAERQQKKYLDNLNQDKDNVFTIEFYNSNEKTPSDSGLMLSTYYTTDKDEINKKDFCRFYLKSVGSRIDEIKNELYHYGPIRRGDKKGQNGLNKEGGGF